MIFHLRTSVVLVNQIRHSNRYAQGANNKRVKIETGLILKKSRVDQVRFSEDIKPHIVAQHCYPGKMPDVGNCFNTVKAMVDQVVGNGILKDDSPSYVATLIFMSPVLVRPEDEGIVLCMDPCIETAFNHIEEYLDNVIVPF